MRWTFLHAADIHLDSPLLGLARYEGAPVERFRDATRAALRRLVTQMYVEGEPLNARDEILNSIRDAQARRSVIVRLDPAPDLEPGALQGRFDIVLNV